MRYLETTEIRGDVNEAEVKNWISYAAFRHQENSRNVIVLEQNPVSVLVYTKLHEKK